jgi:hypothetical protein
MLRSRNYPGWDRIVETVRIREGRRGSDFHSRLATFGSVALLQEYNPDNLDGIGVELAAFGGAGWRVDSVDD